ncbi:MAG: hypothetical protein IIC29_09315, partial [Chloroflexi bacterium]|nr:hypothetical protein [Chloroflexota bacterium]
MAISTTNYTGNPADASYELARQFRGISLRGFVLTVVTIVTAATLLMILAVWLRTHPFESFDMDGLAFISGWDWTGADALFSTIEVFTAAWFGAIIGGVSITYLFIRGHTRQAIGLAVAGAIVGGAAILADFTLGEWVGRDRPLASAESASFPSGHALGTTAFFGFAAYLAISHKLRRPLLI